MGERFCPGRIYDVSWRMDNRLRLKLGCRADAKSSYISYGSRLE